MFQRMINKVFTKQIGYNVRVCMHEIVIKIVKADEHVKNLEEVFNVLKKFRVKLDPEKCVFGVAAGKFMIS